MVSTYTGMRLNKHSGKKKFNTTVALSVKIQDGILLDWDFIGLYNPGREINCRFCRNTLTGVILEGEKLTITDPLHGWR